ncbi:Cytosolic iron-sulfur protein assembly protein [Diplodia intermedia]|uniref:Probable cytosolic iron-sulfur protein assembly protein 1 n=1 Tax=Diplodia intermedia TaxID=856260 RepID=A0ABR3TJF2_9PEZI
MPSTTTTTTDDQQQPPPPPLLHALATLTPPSAARTWMSAPHPTLPVVATASSDRTVRVYSLASFALASTVAGGHKRSPNAGGGGSGMGESVLATGSFDASAGIWRKWEGGANRSGVLRAEGDVEGEDEEEEEDDEEWRFSVILDGHESEIKSVAWSASGQFLATCSRDKSVWVWEEVEADDGFETVAVLQEHEADVKCVAWHPAEDVLASASYDDTIRLYREDVDDWTAVACLAGHEATVWCVDFEAVEVSGLRVEEEGAELPPLSEEVKAERAGLLRDRVASGSRLVSCSDDLTVRVWKMVPKDDDNDGAAAAAGGRNGMPSILRTSSIEEEWVQEAVLPRRHGRAIYSVSWSKKSGLIASTGSDGKIVVYREQWRSRRDNGGGGGDGDAAAEEGEQKKEAQQSLTEWVVVAEVEGAHDVFEINHVAWAQRRDKGRTSEDEEVIISTGDDGEAKLWTLP